MRVAGWSALHPDMERRPAGRYSGEGGQEDDAHDRNQHDSNSAELQPVG